MDVVSIIVGGMLGGLAGWAFSSATAKRREAHRRSFEAIKAIRKMSEMEGEAKNNRARSFRETLQGVLLYTLGFLVIVIMGALMIGSLG